MEVTFRSTRLRRCFEKSASAVREWGPDVGRRYIRLIAELRALTTFEELFTVVHLRAHWLRGRPDDCALTLSGRWRIIVRRGQRDDQVTVWEVNNHYGD